MLLVDDEDDLPAEPTPAELKFADSLDSTNLARIDDALMEQVSVRFLKVARIISYAMDTTGHDSWDDHVLHFYIRRVRHLVESGKLVSQGDLNRPRWCEVRLNQ